jgi:hypothetical protein
MAGVFIKHNGIQCEVSLLRQCVEITPGHDGRDLEVDEMEVFGCVVVGWDDDELMELIIAGMGKITNTDAGCVFLYAYTLVFS